MNEYKVKAKKQFGQHFLKSEKAINDIVNCLEIPPLTHSKPQGFGNLGGEQSGTKIVIEIGPGMGVLTKALLEKNFTVYAIEIDKESIKYLHANFTKYISEKKLIIIEKDFLELDVDNLIKSSQPSFYKGGVEQFKTTLTPALSKGEGAKQQDLKVPYYLVGNIPYYITGLIFRKSFSMKNLPQKVVYLIQKEVAERIMARDKKESILSLSIKFYGIPKIISIVKRGSFNPPPKVDSAILEITPHKNSQHPLHIPPLTPPKLGGEYEQLFFLLIKTAFQHKRKSALSNLKKYLFSKIDKIVWKKIIENISEKERAEDIPLSTWLKIIN